MKFHLFKSINIYLIILLVITLLLTAIVTYAQYGDEGGGGTDTGTGDTGTGTGTDTGTGGTVTGTSTTTTTPTPPTISLPPPCIPSCSGDQCGQDDGCGGTCSDADLNTIGKCGNLCSTDCYCNYYGDCCPDFSGGYSCDGKECGDDGCGGSCGTCSSGNVCSAGFCAPERCPDSTVGLSNMNCPTATVADGASFDINYDFEGTGDYFEGGYKYEHRSLWRDGIKLAWDDSDNGECATDWTAGWTLTGEPSGDHTYAVKSYGSTSSSEPSWTSPDSTISCSVNILPCTGTLNFDIEPSSISPNGWVYFTASGLSNCNGKTIEFWWRQPSSGTTPRPEVLEATCTSTSTGCYAAFQAPSQEGTYTYYAKLLEDSGDIISTTKILEVETCSSTPPSSTAILGNGCTVTVGHYGYDAVDGSYGRWKDSNIQTVGITSTFDDATSGNCDGDLTFENSWYPSSNLISILSQKTWTRKSEFFCQTFGWFCPNDLQYGYSATASGNCKFLEIVSFASCPAGSSCPIPRGIGTNTLTLLQDDTQGSTSFDYRIGECLSNDLGDTSSACFNLYSDKPKCDTDTNMCVAGCATFCSDAKNLGAGSITTSSYESSFTCNIDATNTVDWFKITANDNGKLRITLEPPADTDLNLKVYYSGCSSIMCLSSNSDSATDSCTIDAIAGTTYNIRNLRYYGSGYGTVTASLEECYSDSHCPASSPYCSNNVCVECLNNPDGTFAGCLGTDGTYSTYCPEDSTTPNYILPTCDAANNCQCAGSCIGNAACASGYCCTGGDTQGPNVILPGETLYTCESTSTVSNPWLCA